MDFIKSFFISNKSSTPSNINHTAQQTSVIYLPNGFSKNVTATKLTQPISDTGDLALTKTDKGCQVPLFQTAKISMLCKTEFLLRILQLVLCGLISAILYRSICEFLTKEPFPQDSSNNVNTTGAYYYMLFGCVLFLVVYSFASIYWTSIVINKKHPVFVKFNYAIAIGDSLCFILHIVFLVLLNTMKTFSFDTDKSYTSLKFVSCSLKTSKVYTFDWNSPASNTTSTVNLSNKNNIVDYPQICTMTYVACILGYFNALILLMSLSLSCLKLNKQT